MKDDVPVPIGEFTQAAEAAGYAAHLTDQAVPGRRRFERRPYRVPDPEMTAVEATVVQGLVHEAAITECLHGRPRRAADLVSARTAITYMQATARHLRWRNV